MVKAAFFECLAHKGFREKAQVLDKNKSGRRLKDIITQAITNKDDLEETYATLLDMLMATVGDKVFIEQSDYRPAIKTIIEQLSAWGMLEPIEKPVEVLYDIYKRLSADVHVIPDNTDTGRRLLLGETFFEINIIPAELSKFMNALRDVVDIGTVIELNILGDWIAQDKKIRDRLEGRLAVIENLGLKYGTKKLKRLVKYE